LRIVCIGTSYLPDRTANSLQLMKSCEALAVVGHEVQLIVPAFGRVPSWQELADHYGLHAFFSLRWLPVVRPLRRYDIALFSLLAARAWRPDLLYLWPLQVAGLASLLGMPTALELHDQPQGRLGPTWLRLFLRGRGARRILITTHALKTHLERSFDDARLEALAVVAPNGVDLGRYATLPAPAQARRQLRLPDQFTAVYTGHLYAGRGADLMFELARQRPQISFVWAGGTQTAIESWRHKVSTAGLRNLRIVGHMPHDQVPLLQAAGDVLLMPYGERIETSGGGDSSAFASPMKAIEYLAAGRPILASDLPVIHEILDPDCAVLLPPGDTARWLAALDEIQRGPELGKRLARQAKSRAAQYGWTQRALLALAGLDPDPT